MPPTSPPSRIEAAHVATLTAAAMLAQQVAGKATRDALFLSTFEVSSVPKAMVVSALLSAAGVLGFTRVLTRAGPARAVPGAFLVSAALLMLEWLLGIGYPRAAALAVYAHMGLFGATVTSAFWSLVSERFDPHTAKQVFARITTGGTVGSVVGGLLAWRIAHALDVRMMLPAMAAMNVLCAIGVLGLRPPRAPSSAAPSPGHAPNAPDAPHASDAATAAAPAKAASSVDVLRRTPYLRSLALLVTAGALSQALLDYALSKQAAAAFGRGEALMTFFAFFYVGVGVMSFVLQTTVTRRALESLGLAGTLALFPGGVALAFISVPLLPGLGSAVVVRGAEASLRGSLFRAGYELLYTPIPHDEKRPTKTLIDVGFDRLGTLLGSGFVVVLLAVGPQATDAVLSATAFALAVGAVGFSRALHRGYVAALEKSLRSRAIHLDENDVIDATTRRTLSETIEAFDRKRLLAEIQALRGGQVGAGTLDAPPRSRRTLRDVAEDSDDDMLDAHARADAADDISKDPLVLRIVNLRSADDARIRRTLARANEADARLVAHVIPLLARADLAADATRYLRAIARQTTGQLLDALLDVDAPLAVRHRLPRALAAAPSGRAAAGLIAALDDVDAGVRIHAARALAQISREITLSPGTRDVVFDAVQRELSSPNAVALSGVGALAHGVVDEADLGAGDGDPLFRPDAGAARAPGLVEHVFTLLSAVVDREPLRLAYLALGTEDANLRGTALEYLDVVLPERIRTPLGALLGGRHDARRAQRPAAQVVDDLLSSQQSVSANLAELRRKAKLTKPA